MDIFCDESFVAKIVNLDRSKTFWQESSKVKCSDIKDGKISQIDFPVETPIAINTIGEYFCGCRLCRLSWVPYVDQKNNR